MHVRLLFLFCVCACRFGEGVDILHPLDQPFTSSSGALLAVDDSSSMNENQCIQVCGLAGIRLLSVGNWFTRHKI